uniref:Uncharacterized protein n=1 Tax=Arundo donax TaxID=35708 RepID=A0A0A9BJQ6_ARUDO
MNAELGNIYIPAARQSLFHPINSLAATSFMALFSNATICMCSSVF